MTGQSVEGVVFAISILQKTLGRAFSNQWRMVQKTKGLEKQNPWVVLQIQVCRGICDFNICWKLSRSRLYFLIRNVLVLKY